MAIYTELFTRLNSDDLVLTVNHRLAYYLTDQHKNFAKKESCSKNNTLNIFPLQKWLQDCWTKINFNHQSLLTPAKTAYLWQECILKSNHGEAILNLEQTAYYALKAWKLCKQWQIDWYRDEFNQSIDTLAFHAWAKQFATLCQENNYIDIDSLPEFLIENLASHTHLIPKKIYLLGFDEVTPQIKTLLDTFKKHHCTCIEFSTPNTSENSYQFAAENIDDELYTMATWAFTLHQQGIKNIGCIVPNITEIHDQLEAIFEEVFTPEKILNPTLDHEKAFNISTGKKLSQISWIRIGLQLTQLQSIADIDKTSQIILSPFLPATENEFQKRAKLDAKLRTQHEKYLYLKQVMLIANQEDVTDFAKCLHHHIDLIENINTHRSYPEWANLFKALLDNFAWPGVANSLKETQGILETWHQMLEEFQQLDKAKSVSYQNAIQQLLHLCNLYEFNPQNYSAPVQILGVLEASGIEFDQLWISQISDKTWPGTPSPNSFIPFQIQNISKMSHASAEREFEYCHKLTKRLQKSAKLSIFSYSHAIDEKVKPSIFCKNFPELNQTELSLATQESLAEKIHALNNNNCEYIEDDHGPAITEQELLSGGTAIFKHQAACPFKAFSILRLHATAIEQPSLGLHAKERGILLHEILETTWSTLKSHANLTSYSQTDLSDFVHKIVANVLLRFTAKKPLTMQPYFVELEKQRLTKLTLDWLELEKTRPAFQIRATEKSQTAQFAGIQFKHRADRIDVLTDGSLLIIDYKTGRVTTNHWLGERPQDPQLPLYYLTNNAPITGITYAQVRSDKKQFKGFAKQELNIAGIENYAAKKSENIDTWNQLTTQWQIAFTKIAEEFKQGISCVNPYENDKTCNHCELSLLCRIYHNE